MPKKAKNKGGAPRRAFANKLDKPIALHVLEASELLQLSRQRLDALAREGVFKRNPRGLYDLKDVVQGYIRFLRESAASKTINAADSRVRDARAKDIEARTAQRLGRLVSITLYDEMIESFAGVVRSEL